MRTLSKRSQQVMTAAQQYSRRLGHDFVGTEHILLGLMSEPSGQIADVLLSLGVDPASVEAEIEKLITRQSPRTPAVPAPLTPRANKAIELANQDAMVHGQNVVDPEHLLLGLIREGDGVAGRVLRHVGLDFKSAAERALKDRLEQMKIVERIVRPVRTTVTRKRKMREEFLDHFDGLFEEELARLNDRPAAMQEATKRFGDARKLSAELDSSVSLANRLSYYVERWTTWRAPESVLRFQARGALVLFAVFAALLLPFQAVEAIQHGWGRPTIDMLRVVAGVMLFIPASQVVVGCLYIKLRDAMWGAFGSQRSAARVIAYAGLFAGVILVGGIGFTVLPQWNFLFPTGAMIAAFASMAIYGSVGLVLLAWLRGPVEIRDTVWVMLQLETVAS